MGYKKTDPCIQKAFDDERLFVLMARDPTAPLVIAEWIKLNYDKQPPEKIKEAYECAMEMMDRCTEFNQRKEEQKKRAGLVEKLAKKNLSMSPNFCNDCGGDGYKAHPNGIDRDKCETCGGSGKNPGEQVFIDGDFNDSYEARVRRSKRRNKIPLLPPKENSAHGFTEGADVPKSHNCKHLRCAHPSCDCDDNICPV